MRSFYLLLLILIPLYFNCDYGTVDLRRELNLNFEVSRLNNTPEYWSSYSRSYDIQLDDKVFYKGKKSLRLKYLNDTIDGLSRIYIPFYVLTGKELKVTGYIKTENVKNGYAGFRINVYDVRVKNEEINMKEIGVTGTTGWTEYSLETFVSDSARSVSIGVELTGEGTAWFDGLQLYIDGDKVKEEELPTEE